MVDGVVPNRPRPHTPRTIHPALLVAISVSARCFVPNSKAYFSHVGPPHSSLYRTVSTLLTPYLAWVGLRMRGESEGESGGESVSDWQRGRLADDVPSPANWWCRNVSNTDAKPCASMGPTVGGVPLLAATVIAIAAAAAVRAAALVAVPLLTARQDHQVCVEIQRIRRTRHNENGVTHGRNLM